MTCNRNYYIELYNYTQNSSSFFCVAAATGFYIFNNTQKKS